LPAKKKACLELEETACHQEEDAAVDVDDPITPPTDDDPLIPATDPSKELEQALQQIATLKLQLVQREEETKRAVEDGKRKLRNLHLQLTRVQHHAAKKDQELLELSRKRHGK
jgi:beta-glucosidase-like glycosyl hydrolase